jgi:hypothetical protein
VGGDLGARRLNLIRRTGFGGGRRGVDVAWHIQRDVQHSGVNRVFVLMRAQNLPHTEHPIFWNG